ncbi:conserved hypothetical protein [Neospora caninum Liverpool]|uniref:Uncharacterized protein n=1 Tax=Neospora caninum (strain Liverpool) TaxID=572307 RepID=F0VG96_NEOCL|nr:conserved hypothetical protein [Neospora caninum Liverpool]CBZ52740.1 conserved hypothetical protein [Neospora caninum Liverpool]CEL66721.1 TPA: hypothetical protein BN1204_025280 [Neospora caninum Liverpool]|eukprot:XP_003882772.1 conserved hypothetical protein [Neospora caninum Liverpool]
MHASLSEGAWWPFFLAAAVAATLPLSANAHSAAQLHQHVLSTSAGHAPRCSETHPELCSPSLSLSLSTSPLDREGSGLSETLSKTHAGDGSPASPGRGEWERCRAASSSLSSQRTLGPGVHSTSACSPSASPLPPVALAEVERVTGAGETVSPPRETAATVEPSKPAGDGRTAGGAQAGTASPVSHATGAAGSPKMMSFMEALGRAAAAEAAALGGGAWDWSTWGVGAFREAARGQEAGEEKVEDKKTQSAKSEAPLWGGEWREAVSNFFAKVDKRIAEANGMLHYTDLNGYLL